MRCRAAVKGRRRFCDRHWAKLPRSLRSDLGNAILDERHEQVETLVRLCLENLANQEE